MRMSYGEIRTLVALAIRGLREIRDDDREDLRPPERNQLFDFGEQLEEVYEGLRPWAPDLDEVDDG